MKCQSHELRFRGNIPVLKLSMPLRNIHTHRDKCQNFDVASLVSSPFSCNWCIAAPNLNSLLPTVYRINGFEKLGYAITGGLQGTALRSSHAFQHVTVGSRVVRSGGTRLSGRIEKGTKSAWSRSKESSFDIEAPTNKFHGASTTGDHFHSHFGFQFRFLVGEVIVQMVSLSPPVISYDMI